MFAIILSLLCSIRQGFQTRAAIQAEILALRHQLLVLQRSTRAHKVRLASDTGSSGSGCRGSGVSGDRG